MPLTVCTDDERLSVPAADVEQALRNVVAGSLQDRTSASTGVVIGRSSGSHMEVALAALRADLTESVSSALSFQVELRTVAALPEDLLGWGRALPRGEGDKVDVDF